MPKGDKTGPMGNGQMIGRRMGNCTENNSSGNKTGNLGSNRGRGRRRSMGKQGGRMFRNSSFATNSGNRLNNGLFDTLMGEITNLKNQIADLKKDA